HPDEHSVSTWARSGCMALTGRPDEAPLGPPAPLVARVEALCASIERRAGIVVDGLALLAERAAVAGLTRGGERSCGGATRLLRDAGARVVKVESVNRPDGARAGPSEFFDLLNAGKEGVALDFEREPRHLHDLLSRADVVVEASRPRALAQFDIAAERFLA